MKTTIVYRGAGYPIDPRLEELRQMRRTCDIMECVFMARPATSTFEDVMAGMITALSEREQQCYFLLNQEHADPAHVDGMIHQVDREKRRADRRRIGQLWVKYGGTPNEK